MERNFLTAKERSDYIERGIYPLLRVILKETCSLVIAKNIINRPKQVFNGIDYIAEALWNMNPLHPERSVKWKPAYFIYQSKKFMLENPRPIYPKHYEMTEEEAVTIIQAYVRGYITRKNLRRK